MTKTKIFTKNDLQKVSVIAVLGNDELANYAVAHLPRSWAGLRVWCMKQAAYDNLRGKK